MSDRVQITLIRCVTAVVLGFVLPRPIVLAVAYAVFVLSTAAAIAVVRRPEFVPHVLRLLVKVFALSVAPPSDDAADSDDGI